jgi:hypothetical protein
MVISNEEIIEWVQADDVRQALNGVADGQELHQAVFRDRMDLIHTAIGVTLLDRHQEATKSLELAKKSLETLGVDPDSTELIADRLITRDEFSMVAQHTFNQATVLDERLWRILRRNSPSIFKVVEDGSAVDHDLHQISLKGLRELLETKQLHNFTNAGTSTVHLAETIVAFFSEPRR